MFSFCWNAFSERLRGVEIEEQWEEEEEESNEEDKEEGEGEQWEEWDEEAEWDEAEWDEAEWEEDQEDVTKSRSCSCTPWLAQVVVRQGTKQGRRRRRQ